MNKLKKVIEWLKYVFLDKGNYRPSQVITLEQWKYFLYCLSKMKK